MADPLDKTELAYDVSDEYRPEPAPIPEPPAWQDGSFRVGIHTSIAGDIAGALDIASKLGANALQIFSASPRMWPRGGTRIAEADAARFRARRAELGLGPLVIHDNYLINLASPERVMRTRSIQAFHDELVRAVSLGADFLVAHPGACMGSEKSQAISEIAQGMRQAARGMKLGDLRILVENTSGMGSAVGARFEEIKAILDETSDLPMGVCLDTAHTFEAGYEITTEEGLTRTIEAVERTVGLDRVYVLHVNDSKTPLGSRVDRHEHIGRGKIGLAAFRRILNHPRLGPGSQGLAGRAFILETPIDRPGDDRRNVRALWELVGVDVKQAPGAVDGFSMVRKKPKKKISPQRAQSSQRKREKGKRARTKLGKGRKR
jgi:deoxyribonuclease-4